MFREAIPRRIRELVAAGLLLSGGPLFAHDMWIEPSSFAPRLGQVVGVRLQVGQALVGDPLPLIPALVNEFFVQDAAGRKPVFGRRGADPAGALRVTAPGLQVIGYHSHASTVELEADKFNAYLIEEGLDTITALRASRHETNTKVRERFSRCAKSLVLAEQPSDEQSDVALGFPLELVAERNPYALAAGQDFPVRLTYEGKPLAGALVVAMNSLNPADKQAVRSDQDGRARFQLHPGGMWLIKAVHMVPVPEGSDANWESLWASLTFESEGAMTD